MRLAWLTDIHLNFVDLKNWEEMLVQLEQVSPLDGVLISGDISEAEDLTYRLCDLESQIEQPIYFVLGNHDFYHSQIAAVRDRVASLCAVEPKLTYLTRQEPLALTHGWVLCGEDGWADSRCGDFWTSPVRLNDFELIEDLRALDKPTLHDRLQELGDASATRLKDKLGQALKLGNRILVLTHIPPFREACWYEGQPSDDDWAPFFVCQATGQCLLEFCQAHPQASVLVLCGHTHHPGRCMPLPNLQVWTGKAVYGEPGLSGLIDLSVLGEEPTSRWQWQGSPVEVQPSNEVHGSDDLPGSQEAPGDGHAE